MKVKECSSVSYLLSCHFDTKVKCYALSDVPKVTYCFHNGEMKVALLCFLGCANVISSDLCFMDETPQNVRFSIDSQWRRRPKNIDDKIPLIARAFTFEEHYLTDVVSEDFQLVKATIGLYNVNIKLPEIVNIVVISEYKQVKVLRGDIWGSKTCSVDRKNISERECEAKLVFHKNESVAALNAESNSSFEFNISQVVIQWLREVPPYSRFTADWLIFINVDSTYILDPEPLKTGSLVFEIIYRLNRSCKIFGNLNPLPDDVKGYCSRSGGCCRPVDRCTSCCGLSCDFESECQWNITYNDNSTTVVEVVSAAAGIRNKGLNSGPTTDGNGDPFGHFLFVQQTSAKSKNPACRQHRIALSGKESSNNQKDERRLKKNKKKERIEEERKRSEDYDEVSCNNIAAISSPQMINTGDGCKLRLKTHMNNFEGGKVKIILEDASHAIVASAVPVNSLNKWQSFTANLYARPQPFRVTIEIEFGRGVPAHLALDDIHFEQCTTELPSRIDCEVDSGLPEMFQCSDSRCVSRDRVCDLKTDCPDQSDEGKECNALPKEAYCDFEKDWCGWKSDDANYHWVRFQGNTDRTATGPQFDSTFKNTSGHFLYVNMSQISLFAERAHLDSSKFYPPPHYHSNRSSPYHGSCQFRFSYHMHGPHIGELVLTYIEDGYRTKTSKDRQEVLWNKQNAQGNVWRREVVTLPQNIKNMYFLRFSASRGIGTNGDMAIDDVSFSPECFGLRVNEEHLRGYNYSSWKNMHAGNSFPHYYFKTCGARGRHGPTLSQCMKAYNGTNVTIQMNERVMPGLQIWTVPRTEIYTIFAKGASGGMAMSGKTNRTGGMGAGVRAVLTLTAGQKLHMVIGQEGLGKPEQLLLGKRGSSHFRSKGRNDVKRKSGGGGGATYIYKIDIRTGQSIPLVIAAGGGGAGWNQPDEVEDIDGRGFNFSFSMEHGRSGYEHDTLSGAGGGWNGAAKINSSGQSLIEGATGGSSCDPGHNHGGFGGGGGSCLAGGGGGGFIGGDSFEDETRNGEGGWSFVIPDGKKWALAYTGSDGDGEIEIIMATSGCGCDYRCVPLNANMMETTCMCPDRWTLESDGTTCYPEFSALQLGEPPIIIIIIVATLASITAVSFTCAFLYNRYQRQKLVALSHPGISGADLQLNRLREANGMLTELNPNYEFDGGGAISKTYDLKEIPRENLRLVRALGQGAFGEVYQGYLRHGAGDSVELPVAIKTLPELSSSQAEMDFLMEALIMSKFRHPNIVHFIGVCFDLHPRFIVLELLAGGDLKTFLRENRPTPPDKPSMLTMKDLIKCSIDVAKGCQYLEESRFIHRDIAARNCLLTTKGPGRVVKIADFGMARDIYRNDYYRKGGKAMLPVKWMPPEAFLDGIFTSKTDVWSFGVLLWEVMSLGYMPYPGRGNQEVMQYVTNGGRLESPPGCPGPIYRLMTQCWSTNSEERPTFATILERLGYCLQDPEVLATRLKVYFRPSSSERDTGNRPSSQFSTETLTSSKEAESQWNNSSSISSPTTPSTLKLSSSADYLIPTDVKENKLYSEKRWDSKPEKKDITREAFVEANRPQMPTDEVPLNPSSLLVSEGSKRKLLKIPQVPLSEEPEEISSYEETEMCF